MAEKTLTPNGAPTVSSGDGDATQGVTIAPRVDLLEKDDELILLADMPGVKPEDVDIRFENEIGRAHV